MMWSVCVVSLPFSVVGIVRTHTVHTHTHTTLMQRQEREREERKSEAK